MYVILSLSLNYLWEEKCRKTKAPLHLILFGGGLYCQTNSSKNNLTQKGIENVKEWSFWEVIRGIITHM